MLRKFIQQLELILHAKLLITQQYHQLVIFLRQQESLRLKIIERLLKEGSSAEEPINIQLSDYSSDEGSSSNSDNEGKSCSKNFLDLEGPCCHPLRVPPCSPELNIELRKPHKFKFRLKSLHRRKKDERLLLDMPTTDPGSDLLFSTDDEYIDANGVVTCCSTMPSRVKRHLLKSELQKRYIEQIGDGLRDMPPELIITSPSKKDKQRNNSLRIFYQPSTVLGRKSHISHDLPFIEQPAKRTSSWHNFNMTDQTSTLTACKSGVTRNKAQSPSYKQLTKKEILSKEDLDIKLSLKKKIWTGMQPDDISGAIDRTKPLSWEAPHFLKNKSITSEQNLINDLYLTKLSSGGNIKYLENEAFLTACSQKLMEWQIMKTNTDNVTYNQRVKVPLKLVIPNINDERTMYMFKHLNNIKASNSPAKPDIAISSGTKPKRTVISKVVESRKMIAKMSKSKSRNNITTSHRASSKQTLNHKPRVRCNKFKTGSLVVTAVQTGVCSGASGIKKNKKLKALQHKLPRDNSSNTKMPQCTELQRPTVHTINTISNNTNSNNTYNDNNKIQNHNSKSNLVMAASTTPIARKVKTKFKKKNLSSNTKPEDTINLNAIYTKSYDCT